MARAKGTLPILDALRIAEPCDASWEAMGGGAVRRCDACDLEVWDLASLTAAQVRGALALGGERFCARVTRDVDGGVQTRDARRPAATAMLLGGALALLSGEALAQDAGAPLARVEVSLGAVVRGTSVAFHRSTTVAFLGRSLRPTRASLDVLRAVAEVMREHLDLRRVRLVGHVPEGSPRALGLRRARWVRERLAGMGVDPDRLVPDEVVEARGAARRPGAREGWVEFVVVDPPR
ncbi:MAG: hypothetical protein R3A48_25970 [Polyangiales bacterium]